MNMYGKVLGNVGKVQVKEVDVSQMIKFYEEGKWAPSLKEKIGDEPIESAISIHFLDEEGDEYDSGIVMVFTESEKIYMLTHVDSPVVKEISFSQ